MPKVFVSYSHKEPEHDHWAVDLASDLRRNGVDATLDVWDLTGGQDKAYFMESQIRDSNFVILVCTPLYAKKSNIPKGGVGYEKNIISAEMLQASDLRPKFIPILREGTYENALPTYLGSKYAIDFRNPEDREQAIDELLRVIYRQPHPDKPPLGPTPSEKIVQGNSEASTEAKRIYIEQDIDSWVSEALGRFDYLRADRLNVQKADPFKHGYWQASFVLNQDPHRMGLSDFLEILRASKTNRTGWDVGWVPTRTEIAPYPYQGGIEVWLAEDGDKESGLSDFWRAVTCLGIVDTPRGSIFCRYRRCVYERPRNFTSEKAV